MQTMTLEHFAGRLNESFAVDTGAGPAPFVLVEARPLPPVAGFHGTLRAPFSLLFRHEAAVLFPQKVYPMTHAALGQFGIFLVPVARDRDGFIYQAVFN
ncbi:hypothetical protein CS053_00140 [Rhodanobacter glycinis]|uniref:DUF6916 domain-containing protein n=1 Tax=Rhodanobacter glycinis TaxID=582702 RepID=A0A5B9DVA1_9GAMM|nr:hypothetical protein [Rhodanobacter glycinis]QEE23078.1 hypothetical protein CS053_00140 [Rhodanobacter glycinis]